MTEDPQMELLESIDVAYEDVAVQMEDMICSFQYLQGEIELALEELQEDLDKIRDRLNQCSNMSVAYYEAANAS